MSASNTTFVDAADSFQQRGMHMPQRERGGASTARAEAAAFRELSRVLAADPAAAPTCVLDIARALCQAGTAGLSVLRTDAARQPTLQWQAVRGALAAYEGIDVSRHVSPCGACLDAGSTLLLSGADAAFGGLKDLRPPIAEELIVPLYDSSGAALGTLWLAHHAGTDRFSPDDVQVLERLAQQLAFALMLQKQAAEQQHSLTYLRAHELALQKLLEHELHRERALRTQAEASEREAVRALHFREAMMREADHRTKNSLQSATSLLSMQARAASSIEVRRALLDARDRLHVLVAVHTRLSRDTDATQAVSMPSLLDDMCDALRQSFGACVPGVALRLNCDQTRLPPGDATAIALFCNEAVTNAYKHAFPTETTGSIAVRLQMRTETTLAVQIVDSGIGMRTPEGGTSVGMGLLRTLAAQLHGEMDVAAPTEGGTKITLTMQREVS